MPARSLADALADSPARPLIDRLAKTQRLSRALAEVVAPWVPDFDAHDPRSIELRDGVLILNARSAAQAAKLRQGSPGLLRHLHQTGAQVTEIRVRVQPARTTYPEQANTPPQVSPRAKADPLSSEPASVPATSPPIVAGVKELAQTLADALPDSPLQRAAERLRKALIRRERRRAEDGGDGDESPAVRAR
jgi:hypothetical protein